MMAVALAALSHAAHAEGQAGSEWVPVEIAGGEVEAPDQRFMRFGGDGKLSGHAGCNRFFATYLTDADAIEIGPVGATRMLCPDQIMEKEQQFLQVLQEAAVFEREGIALVLKDADGNVLACYHQTNFD